MILVRLILIFILVYLIVRYALDALNKGQQDNSINEPEKRDTARNKKISKKIGEYVDYEEVDE